MGKNKDSKKENWNEYRLRAFAILVVGIIVIMGLTFQALVEIFGKC